VSNRTSYINLEESVAPSTLVRPLPVFSRPVRPLGDISGINSLQLALNVKYAFLSAIVLLLYDTVINFSDEIHLIWLQRLSVGKVLYIVTRYGCFLDVAVAFLYSFSSALSVDSCRVVYEIANWIMTFGVHTCQVVLIIRTYAIWGQNRFILAYLCGIQLTAITSCIFLLYFSNKSVIFMPSPSPTLVSCVPILGNNKLFFDYCLVLVVEINFLFVLLVKGFSQWRINSTPFVRTLYRDGVVYFVVLFSVSLTNVIFVETSFNTPYFYIATEHQRIFISIFASRLIINVRKAALTTEESDVTTVSAEGFYGKLAGSLDFTSGVTVVIDDVLRCTEDE